MDKRVIVSFVAGPLPHYVLRDHPYFQHGLLMNIVEKGAFYPAVHFAPINSLNTLMETKSLGLDHAIHQGIYEEVQFMKMDEFTDYKHLFIVLVGHPGIDSTFSEVLDDSWKDWAGTRRICLNLGYEFKIPRAILYRRIKPTTLELCSHLVMVEILGPNKDSIWTLVDLVRRIRTENMGNYTSVYTICKQEDNFYKK